MNPRSLPLPDEPDDAAWQRNALGEAFWMPFTPHRAFRENPRLFVSASGMFYETAEGRRVLDAMAGLWCVNAGHGHRQIVEAIQKQAATLDFVSSFQMSHPAAFRLAERLAAMTPPGLDHIFFTNSGSESVDTALKIARAYHRCRGQAQRFRFIGRHKAYHGMGWGGLSVSGIGRHRRDFGVMLPGVDHLPHPYDSARAAFSKGQPDDGAQTADELLKLIDMHDASTIAAVIVEPVTGSAGVYPPPRGYLERLREICTAHGILLIFDEVITGFGRLGSAFAANHWGITPDLMCLAKGLTNGAAPMGAVVASSAIHEAFMGGPKSGIELFHGYTYSAHPLACAAALATLDVYVEQSLFARAARLAPLWQEALHGLRDARHVIDIRNIGLLGALDLQPGSEPGQRARHVGNACFDRGLLVRASGDTIILSPPLVIEEAQIGFVMETLAAVLAETP
jgi:beta-alanine--pyruvate transaminase